MAFTGNDDMMVAHEYDSSMKLIKSVKLGFNGYIFDIVTNNHGFSIYAKDTRDNNHAFLYSFDPDFKQIAMRTLMNNGDSPTVRKQQISFSNKFGSSEFGTEIMFSPSSGKLAYGRGRIGLIFSHYNAFGTPTQRNDHQGDTNYSFNRRIQNERISWNWKSSHSLIQTQIYDGQFFNTASLAEM